MLERERREKLLELIEQAEKLMDAADTNHSDFMLAARICRTVCADIREVCRISEECDAVLIEKLERIRRIYETGK